MQEKGMPVPWICHGLPPPENQHVPPKNGAIFQRKGSSIPTIILEGPTVSLSKNTSTNNLNVVKI